jgi:hypothetical protein
VGFLNTEAMINAALATLEAENTAAKNGSAKAAPAPDPWDRAAEASRERHDDDGEDDLHRAFARLTLEDWAALLGEPYVVTGKGIEGPCPASRGKCADDSRAAVLYLREGADRSKPPGLQCHHKGSCGAWVSAFERVARRLGSRREAARAIKNAAGIADPRPRCPETPGTETGTERPTIEVCPQIKNMVDEAELAIGRAGVGIFHRGGELVRLRVVDGRLVIEPLPAPSLLEMLSSVARWQDRNKDGEPYERTPPRDVAAALASRGDFTHIRELVDVTERPTLRQDGSVLATPGYDSQSRIFYQPSTSFPAVPDAPTDEEAIKALDVLEEVFGDFPFVHDYDRIAAVALVLTLLGRNAVAGPLPFFTVSSPGRGTGKGLLTNAAAMIATGIEAPVMTGIGDRAEEAKTLLALGREATPLAFIDNLETIFGSDVLAAAATARKFKGRLLGQNRTIAVPVPVVVATGKNLQVRSDVGRRVVPINLDAKVELAEERSGFKHPDLIAWIRAERPKLVAAGLTVLRWHFSAARPATPLSAFGSFEAWSGLVRTVLHVLTDVDACAGRARLREDGDADVEAHAELLQAWHGALGDRKLLFSAVIEEAERLAAKRGEDGKPAPETRLRDALVALDPRSKGGELRRAVLAKAIPRLKNVIVNGLVLEREPQKTNKGVLWRVTLVTTSDAAKASTSPGFIEPRVEVTETGDVGDDQ